MKNWRKWDHTKLILFGIGLIAVICGIVIVIVLKKPNEQTLGFLTLGVGKIAGLFGFSRNGIKKKDHQLTKNCADTEKIKEDINSLKEDMRTLKTWIKGKEK